MSFVVGRMYSYITSHNGIKSQSRIRNENFNCCSLTAYFLCVKFRQENDAIRFAKNCGTWLLKKQQGDHENREECGKAEQIRWSGVE